MTPDNTETNRDWTRRGVISSTIAAAAATIPASAAAQTTEDVDALFADEEFSRSRALGAFVQGLLFGIEERVSFGDEETDGIDTHVTAAVTEFQDHQSDWVSYVNERDLGSADRQVLELTFEYASETRTRYVIADYDETAEEYASVSIVSDTDRTVDASATLRDLAVENAADELQVLHEGYIGPGEDIPRSHFSELAGQYYFGSDHVTASFLGGG